MAKQPTAVVKILDKDKFKIVKFIITHFNNFTFGTYGNVTIRLNQPIPTKIIIALSNFALRNNYELEIDDKLLTFKIEENV